jgi:hypothetical protein
MNGRRIKYIDFSAEAILDLVIRAGGHIPDTAKVVYVKELDRREFCAIPSVIRFYIEDESFPVLCEGTSAERLDIIATKEKTDE